MEFFERIKKYYKETENLAAIIPLVTIVALLTIEVFSRFLRNISHFFSTFNQPLYAIHSVLSFLPIHSIKGSSLYIQHLVLWITFIGAIITSRENRHLRLSAGTELLKEKQRDIVNVITSFLTVSVTSTLSYSSYQFLKLGFEANEKVGIFPIDLFLIVIPLGFLGIVLRTAIKKEHSPIKTLIILSGALIPLIFSRLPWDYTGYTVWPSIIVLITAMLLGAPVFVVLAGIAAALFFNSSGDTTVIPNETYTMLTGPVIPTIPLFTLAGFILSESKAGERLVRFFQAVFGWMPGGLAIMATVVCAFFTTFTGASGVTILALGGLLSYVLIESKYSKDFTTGLLTASGSIGLLFPPSLPIILYGVVAHISIKKMFIGGILPGILMVLTLSLLGIYNSRKQKVKRPKFSLPEAITALKNSIWEILLPVIILFTFFAGHTTLVETGAVAVVYTIITQVFIHKDLSIKKIYNVLLKVLPITGGVLIILAVAKGLSYYIVDAEIPMLLTEWTKDHIHSKFVFLILLNIALLITGCFMDIFSAIIVVVPLIIPLGEAFGIHPVHLGIIFLANLELGYLTPPVGLNLFLAAFRFEEPLLKIYKDVIPFLIALIIAVLLITYVPALTTFLLQ